MPDPPRRFECTVLQTCNAECNYELTSHADPAARPAVDGCCPDTGGTGAGTQGADTDDRRRTARERRLALLRATAAARSLGRRRLGAPQGAAGHRPNVGDHRGGRSVDHPPRLTRALSGP